MNGTVGRMTIINRSIEINNVVSLSEQDLWYDMSVLLSRFRRLNTCSFPHLAAHPDTHTHTHEIQDSHNSHPIAAGMGSTPNHLVAKNLDLLKTGRYSDFTLICGDEKYHLHRNIVLPDSSVIATAIDGDSKVRLQSTIANNPSRARAGEGKFSKG